MNQLVNKKVSPGIFFSSHPAPAAPSTSCLRELLRPLLPPSRASPFVILFLGPPPALQFTEFLPIQLPARRLE